MDIGNGQPNAMLRSSVAHHVLPESTFKVKTAQGLNLDVALVFHVTQTNTYHAHKHQLNIIIFDISGLLAK